MKSPELCVLIFTVAVNFAADAMLNLLQQMNQMGIQPQDVLFQGGNPYSKFQKVYEDVICNDRIEGRSMGKMPFQKCKEECSRNQDCMYIGYWLVSKKCVQYQTCYRKLTPGVTEKIAIWKKVTACEERMPEITGQICAQFPAGVLRTVFLPFEWEKGGLPESAYQNPNFHCSCLASRWMTCGIFPTIGTNDANTLLTRLLVEDEELLRPFIRREGPMRGSGGEQTILLFEGSTQEATEGSLHDQVYADIHVLPFNPYRQYHTNPCFHLQQCLANGEGRDFCPVTGKTFESGDPVWVFAEDTGFVRHRRPVRCISTEGMRATIVRGGSEEGFYDPLGRIRTVALETPRRKMKLDIDYKMFFIFDDAAMRTGICSPAPIDGMPSQSPPFLASLNLGEVGGSSSGSAPGLSEPAEEGTQKSEGKKPRRRGGQKHKKSVAASSTNDPPEEIDLTTLQQEEHLEKSLAEAAEVLSLFDSKVSTSRAAPYEFSTFLTCWLLMLILLTIYCILCEVKSQQRDVYIEF